jgi:DNA-binding NarL/FixJ family response regulator
MLPRILILTTFDLDEYVYAALRAGASGFMLKDTPPAELLAAIRVIAGGDALLAPSVTRRLIADVRQPGDQPALSTEILESLTGREREVFGLVAKGMSNQELADALHMSAATAKTHVSRVLMKLGRARPGAACGYRLRNGVHHPGVSLLRSGTCAPEWSRVVDSVQCSLNVVPWRSATSIRCGSPSTCHLLPPTLAA